MIKRFYIEVYVSRLYPCLKCVCVEGAKKRSFGSGVMESNSFKCQWFDIEHQVAVL